jgi:DNA repair exonuclease SbcCD ATPase subunit
MTLVIAIAVAGLALGGAGMALAALIVVRRLWHGTAMLQGQPRQIEEELKARESRLREQLEGRINALGEYTERQIQKLSDEFDLEVGRVEELEDRAKALEGRGSGLDDLSRRLDRLFETIATRERGFAAHR